jgi:hypothetical protein
MAGRVEPERFGSLLSTIEIGISETSADHALRQLA